MSFALSAAAAPTQFTTSGKTTKKFTARSASRTSAGASRKSIVAMAAAAAPKRIVIAGAPASGKGTQCELIVQKFGLVHISAGDLLRAAVAEGTAAGNEAKVRPATTCAHHAANASFPPRKTFRKSSINPQHATLTPPFSQKHTPRDDANHTAPHTV
jgi:hypothetical protein